MIRIIIHPKRLLQSAIISNVLALRHPAVEIQTDLLYFIPRILVHNALCSFSECSATELIGYNDGHLIYGPRLYLIVTLFHH